ncbi:MAG: insulinase family protein, partial [Gammaproteobacteria bacterium]|nr:insulinase family protein [Gammaproteobacteria bacterium]
VSASELARIQAQVVAEKVYELDSVFYQAMQIGILETVGLDWRLADEYPDRLKEVTPEQIRTVANRYLVNDGLTVAILEPLPMEKVDGQ